MFLGSKEDIKKAQRMYYELEDAHTERQILKKEGLLKPRNDSSSEFSFEKAFEKFLLEKSFLKNNTQKVYKWFSHFMMRFLRQNDLFYLADFKREHSIIFLAHCKNSNLSDSTILQYCNHLKIFLDWAVHCELIDKNPFILPRFKINPAQLEEIKPFGLDEVLELIKHSEGELRLYLIVAFFTGARTGEILALTFADLDFENRLIHINKTLSQDGVLDTPKTISSIRFIDMLDIVYKELIKLNFSNPNARIFKSARYVIRTAFVEIQKKLGFEIRRLYDTRHTFASFMLSRGEEPMWVGCKMLGHKNLNETYRSYAKFLPSEHKKRATFLDRIVI